MKKILFSIAAAAVVVASAPVYAGQQEFCAGFAEGYKSVKGDMVLLPICPMAPMTPLGSNDYREGIKAGIRAAGR